MDSKDVLVDPGGSKSRSSLTFQITRTFTSSQAALSTQLPSVGIFGVPAENRVERITVRQSLAGITDSWQNAIDGYSHGMKQKAGSDFMLPPSRLMFGRAICWPGSSSKLRAEEDVAELYDTGSAVFFLVTQHVLEVNETLQ